MIEIGTVLQDRYLIKKQIGAGGMGAVYLAVDQRFDSNVALKETFFKDEELSRAFEREARLLNSLHHSVLPHVSDYFIENDEHFLVMQYIEGDDLSESLKQKKQFAVETVLQWTNDLLDALDYLHSQNPPIIHRDIKPQNLKITPRGNIVLLDFGLAKLKSEDSSAQSVFGYSRRYSPLEQIQGIGTDARSDIFSLAATVFYLLTGEPPIDALNRAAAIVAGVPDPLKMANEIRSEIPVRVAIALKKALSLNSADRFESADAMCEALKDSSAANSEVIENEAVEIPFVADAAENPPVDKIFPALAAFAADNQINNPPDEQSDKAEASKAVLHSARKAAVPVMPDEATDIQTQVSSPVLPVRRKSRMPIAIGLILLLCVGLSAAFFITKAKSPLQTSESPVSQSNTDASATNSALPVNVQSQQPAASTATENTENSELKKETAKVEKSEKPATDPVSELAKKEAIHQNTAANPKRAESRTNGETRQRVVENAPPDNVDDSDNNWRARQRRQRMQRQDDDQIIDMSEDEWRDYQRQQNQRRQRRQRPVREFPY